jgi:hypothetical protein
MRHDLTKKKKNSVCEVSQSTEIDALGFVTQSFIVSSNLNVRDSCRVVCVLHTSFFEVRSVRSGRSTEESSSFEFEAIPRYEIHHVARRPTSPDFNDCVYRNPKSGQDHFYVTRSLRSPVFTPDQNSSAERVTKYSTEWLCPQFCFGPLRFTEQQQSLPS